MEFVAKLLLVVLAAVGLAECVGLLGDLIEMQFLGSAYNPHLGSAISLMMLLLVIVAMLIMNRFGDGEEGAVMM